MGEIAHSTSYFPHVIHKITNCHNYSGRFAVEAGDGWMWSLILWIRVKTESSLCSLCLLEWLLRDWLSCTDFNLLQIWPKPQVLLVKPNDISRLDPQPTQPQTRQYGLSEETHLFTPAKNLNCHTELAALTTGLQKLRALLCTGRTDSKEHFPCILFTTFL